MGIHSCGPTTVSTIVVIDSIPIVHPGGFLVLLTYSHGVARKIDLALMAKF